MYVRWYGGATLTVVRIWLDPFVKPGAYERTWKVHRSEMKPSPLPPDLSIQKKKQTACKRIVARCVCNVSRRDIWVFERSARNDHRLALFISV